MKNSFKRAFKKGFTIAEVMVTLGILSFVLWLTLPILNFTPSYERLYVNVAFPVINTAVSEVVDTSGYSQNRYWGTDTAFNANNMCDYMGEVIDSITTSCAGTSSLPSPNYILSNGAHVWGVEGLATGLNDFINGITGQPSTGLPNYDTETDGSGATIIVFDGNSNGVTETADGENSNLTYSYNDTGGSPQTATLVPHTVTIDVNGEEKTPNTADEDQFEVIIIPKQVTWSGGAWTYATEDLTVMAPTGSLEEGLLNGMNTFVDELNQ